ncbi:hypothetical protein [Lysobacter fragariae]
MDIKKITLDPRTITWRLALVAMLLVATNMGMQAYRLFMHREHVFGLAMISLDGEHNLPSLFSTALLLSASGLLALITMLTRAHKAPDVSKWAILSIGFLLMGLDEDLALHELLIAPMRTLLGGQHLGIFFFAWVIPGIFLVVGLGLFFLSFMLRLPRRTAIAFAISAAIYLGGALGVELVEGWWRENHAYRDLIYQAMVSLEEGMEMAGVIAFIHALLRYVAGRYGEVRIGIEGAHAVAADSFESVTKPASGLQEMSQTVLRPTGE